MQTCQKFNLVKRVVNHDETHPKLACFVSVSAVIVVIVCCAVLVSIHVQNPDVDNRTEPTSTSSDIDFTCDCPFGCLLVPFGSQTKRSNPTAELKFAESTKLTIHAGPDEWISVAVNSTIHTMVNNRIIGLCIATSNSSVRYNWPSQLIDQSWPFQLGNLTNVGPIRLSKDRSDAVIELLRDTIVDTAGTETITFRANSIMPAGMDYAAQIFSANSPGRPILRRFAMAVHLHEQSSVRRVSPKPLLTLFSNIGGIFGLVKFFAPLLMRLLRGISSLACPPSCCSGRDCCLRTVTCGKWQRYPAKDTNNIQSPNIA